MTFRLRATVAVSLWSLAFIAGPFRGHVSAQMRVTTQDSVSLRVAAISVVLDSIYRREIGQRRMWILLHTDQSASRDSPRPPTHEERVGLIAAYPTAQFISARDDVFDCPPGATIWMPVSGCPILEDGIIVELSRFSIGDTRGHISASIVESREDRSRSRTRTSAAGMAMQFKYQDGKWIFVEETMRWAT